MATNETKYPVYYQKTHVTMARLRELFEPKMHPEFARRLFPWIEAQNGVVGIGGGWRKHGEQPDKPGFAPEGRSFHQSQQFTGGPYAYAAVDLVASNLPNIHRRIEWDEVPEQGGFDAARWGVHCNVSSESWHMQPIELDGYSRWESAGKPDLEYGYPIPGDASPVPGGNGMTYFKTPGSKTATWVVYGDQRTAFRVTGPALAAAIADGFDVNSIKTLSAAEAKGFDYVMSVEQDTIGL